jgi:hypothetical protein
MLQATGKAKFGILLPSLAKKKTADIFLMKFYLLTSKVEAQTRLFHVST